MAVGLKTRICYREHVEDTSISNYWAGNYKLLIRAKSIPSPFGDPNMVDVSTLEDWYEMQEEGRRSAASMEVQGAFEKAYKDLMVENEGKKLDFLIMYGTDGRGREGICAFTGTESFVPDEATDDHLTGTCRVAISTAPRWIEDSYDVVVTEDEMGYPTNITLSGRSSTAKTISLDKATSTLEVGSTVMLHATTFPTNATVTWQSSDTSVATVRNGLVTAVSAGSATITATNDTVSSTCAVTVSAGA